MFTIDPNDENIILEIPADVDPNEQTEPAKKEKVKNVFRFLLWALTK